MQKKQNEISENVIQGNQISRAFYKMDVNEQRLITFAMYNLEKTREVFGNVIDSSTKKTTKIYLENYTAHFSIKKMCDVMGIEYNEQTQQNYKKALLKLPSRILKIDNEIKSKSLPFVILTEWDKEQQEVQLVFNPYFFNAIFNALNYSKINMQIFGALKKHASQRLYFYLLSYRNMCGKYNNQSGIWEINTTVSELRNMFLLKDGEISRTASFVERYIKNPVAEINQHNFEFTVDYKTSGKPTKNVTFICCEKLNLKQLPPNENKKMREKAIEINNEKKLMQKYKERYANEWAILLKEKINTQFLDFNFSEEVKLEMIEFDIFKELKRRHDK